MGIKEKPVDRGNRRAELSMAELGQQLRLARLRHGLSQAHVARAAGLSPSFISKIERGRAAGLCIRRAYVLCAVVGLDLSMKTYLGGEPVRDAAQLALLERFSRLLPAAGSSLRFEVALPLPGDMRAWDAVVAFDQGYLAVEAETRVGDVQALQRELALKLRDDPSVKALVLLVANTRHNREVLRIHRAAFHDTLPFDGDAIRRSLGMARLPSPGGLLVL